ncbi:MAG: hypothetical protein ACOYZ6_14625 [Chloroflexota bacterium]
MQPHPDPVHKKILLYGNSILITGLACRLQEAGFWEVERVEDGPLGELEGVEMVAYDVSEPASAKALSRLREATGPVLIGLDAHTDTVTVLTGQSHPAHSFQEVQELLEALTQARAGGQPAAKDEDELPKKSPEEVSGPKPPS